MESKLVKTNSGELIHGPLIIKNKIYEDKRGFFYESWNKSKFNNLVSEEINFDQDNHSKSQKGVLRGLHYQLYPQPQGKLVRCIKGEIFDVAVDVRKKSKTFGKWIGCYLNDQNKNELWVPVGFAHGFLSLSDSAEVIYKTSGYWDKDCERSIIWNDKTINIEWPLFKSEINSPVLSQKDNNAPTLQDALEKGEIL